jgi:hypothetical protein
MFEWNINDEYNIEIINAELKGFEEYNKINKDFICFANSSLNCEAHKKSSNKIEINTEEIIKLDFKKHNPLEIISMQIKIISYLLNYYKMCKLDDINIYTKYLYWIYETSVYLCSLIKQPVNKNKTNLLMRSSYKFCNKKCDCQSQYGFLFNKKSRNCINDHYVHNKIVSDIDNLLNYIKNSNNNLTLDVELRKGLETLNYVTNHMYQELSSFMLYLNNNKTKYNIYDFYKCIKK